MLLYSLVLEGTEIQEFLELAWPISSLLGPKSSKALKKGSWCS